MIQLIFKEEDEEDFVVYGIDLDTKQVVFIPPLPLSDYIDARPDKQYGWVITREKVLFINQKK